MTTVLQTLTLLQVTDSSFPSGAFAFSNGLEGVIQDGFVRDAAQIEEILRDHLVPRWLMFDRVFLSAAHVAAATSADLDAVDSDCNTRMVAPAMRAASLGVGRSLLTTHARMQTPTAAAWHQDVLTGSRWGHAPVVQGAMGAALGLDLAEVAAGALFGQISAAISACIRMGRLGALEAQKIVARILATAAAGLAEPCPALPSGFSPLLDIAAQRRPVGRARLFAN